MANRKISQKLEFCNQLAICTNCHQAADVDLNKLRRMFLSFEANGRGLITFYGLANILKDPSLQMSDDAIASFIAEFDVNRKTTEAMDLCEFLDMIHDYDFSKRQFKQLIQRAIIRKSAIVKSFLQYDKPGVGYVTTKQFRLVMRNQKVIVSEDEIDAMIKVADYDANGKIYYEEFALVMID